MFPFLGARNSASHFLVILASVTCITYLLASIYLVTPVESSFHPFNQWPLYQVPNQEYFCESRIEVASHLICCRKLCYDSEKKKSLTTYHISCKTRLERPLDASFLVRNRTSNNVTIDCNRSSDANLASDKIRNRYELNPRFYFLRGENSGNSGEENSEKSEENPQRSRGRDSETHDGTVDRFPDSPITEKELKRYQEEFNCTVKGFNERGYFEKRSAEEDAALGHRRVAPILQRMHDLAKWFFQLFFAWIVGKFYTFLAKEMLPAGLLPARALELFDSLFIEFTNLSTN